MKNNIYIADIQSIFPPFYDAEFVAGKLYPIDLYGKKINLLAKRLAKKFNIPQRSTVIDIDLYPEIKLANQENHPKKWGEKIINKLTTYINKDEIGFFGLSYNISANTDSLPNLAAQIAMQTDLANLEKISEISYFGCAAVLFSLEEAFDFCKKHEKPAIVFTFDQCSMKSLQLKEQDPDFYKMLITNLLFTDGGVGAILIPEKYRYLYKKPVLKIIDIQTKYIAGNMIHMKNGKFLMGSNLKNVIPKAVSSMLVKPFMSKNKIDITEIKEWSIHQGGPEIIEMFCNDDCLGLKKSDIQRSLDIFHKYGNTSAASCMLVLESFFNEKKLADCANSKSMLLSFGAGYFLGTALFEWSF